jgi:anti-anti-sigma factor
MTLLGEFRAELVEEPSANGDGTRQIVHLVGEVDVATTPSLASAFGVSFAHRCTVVVNLAGVTFFGASGIGELIRAQKHLRAVGCELIVMNAPPNVRRVFTICGLQDMLSDG